MKPNNWTAAYFLSTGFGVVGIEVGLEVGVEVGFEVGDEVGDDVGVEVGFGSVELVGNSS